MSSRDKSRQTRVASSHVPAFHPFFVFPSRLCDFAPVPLSMSDYRSPRVNKEIMSKFIGQEVRMIAKLITVRLLLSSPVLPAQRVSRLCYRSRMT